MKFWKIITLCVILMFTVSAASAGHDNGKNDKDKDNYDHGKYHKTYKSHPDKTKTCTDVTGKNKTNNNDRRSKNNKHGKDKNYNNVPPVLPEEPEEPEPTPVETPNIITPQNGEIQWDGLTWDVRSEPGEPGPNTWNANGVYIDAKNRLHLTIDGKSGVWKCSEVDSRNKYGYGTFTWTVDSPVFSYDKNSVVGLFTYLDDSQELDVEISKWNEAAGNNLWYSVQPYSLSGNNYGSTENYAGTTIHTIVWTHDAVRFKTTTASGEVLSEFTYSGKIPSNPQYAIMNLWLADGKAPSDGKNIDLVISDFSYVPYKAEETLVEPPEEIEEPAFTIVNPHEGNTWWYGADGQRIALINNNQADEPTYSELVAFIQADPTDEARYTNSYQCGDFAETFHNNAEKSGIKAAWVALDGINHACNAVQTSDKGLVFVDCTGTTSGGECYDTTVSVSAGSPYKRVSLFCSESSFGSMGTVTDYKVYW